LTALLPGAVCGLAAALVLARATGAFLCGAGGDAPLTLVLAPLLLLAIAAAGLLPALRATRVGPLRALRGG
jgi:ABC-type antimicrobial peptide transport system permease subunit